MLETCQRTLIIGTEGHSGVKGNVLTLGHCIVINRDKYKEVAVSLRDRGYETNRGLSYTRLSWRQDKSMMRGQGRPLAAFIGENIHPHSNFFQ